MPFPKRITTEYLPFYGFESIQDNPYQVRQHQYKSFRTQCSTCLHWVIQAEQYKGKWYCESCLNNRRKPPKPEPCSKIYVCCDDEECSTRRAIRQILSKHDTTFTEKNHDGVGGQHIKVKSLPPENTDEKREFLTAIFSIAEPHIGYLKLKHS